MQGRWARAGTGPVDAGGPVHLTGEVGAATGPGAGGAWRQGPDVLSRWSCAQGSLAGELLLSPGPPDLCAAGSLDLPMSGQLGPCHAAFFMLFLKPGSSFMILPSPCSREGMEGVVGL